jgi:hypothetical protein
MTMPPPSLRCVIYRAWNIPFHQTPPTPAERYLSHHVVASSSMHPTSCPRAGSAFLASHSHTTPSPVGGAAPQPSDPGRYPALDMMLLLIPRRPIHL